RVETPIQAGHGRKSSPGRPASSRCFCKIRIHHKSTKSTKIGARDEPSEAVLVPIFLVSFVSLWWILLRPNLLSDDHAHQPRGGAAWQDLRNKGLWTNGFLRSLQSTLRRPRTYGGGRSQSKSA